MGGCLEFPSPLSRNRTPNEMSTYPPDSGYILSVARQSASTGEPIVRSMEYAFPHQGYERVNDQFLLGDLILVAPVLEKGASQRAVMLPAGAWEGIDGKQYAGPCRMVVPVAPDQLCYFEKVTE